MKIRFNASDWNKIVKSCVPFCSVDEEHEELHNVFVDALGNECTVAGCNGYILGVFHMPCAMSDRYEETHWRLPRVLHQTQGAFVTVSDEENQSFVTVLYEDLPADQQEVKEGRHFDWQDIIQTSKSRQNDTSISVNPNKLIAALTPFKDRESLVDPVTLFIGNRTQPIYMRKMHNNHEIEVICLPIRSYYAEKK